jgi:large subunit ribosomal protein L24
MKKEFSKSWKSSKQPRKQRKYLAKAPLHIRKKFVGANLSKELRKKHNKRNISLVKGDIVKILRGKFRGKKGKILSVNLSSSKITIENINVKKQDGSKVPVKIIPSNVQIIELNLNDSRRKIKTETSKKSSSTKVNKEKEENAPKKTKSA